MPVFSSPASEPDTAALGEFLREVEVAFHDDWEKYNQFCKLWQDFHFRRIHFLVLEAKLKSLFQGHNYLILEFNKLVPTHSSQFFEAVKVALKDDYHAFIKVFEDYRTLKDDYHDFIKVFQDYRARKIDERCLSSRVKELLREHAFLISQTNTNTLVPAPLPRWDQLTMDVLSVISQKPSVISQKPPWDELTFDVLSVISQKLDFADLFQFSRVCTNWRLFHKSIDKSKLLISQEPLLVEFLKYPVKLPYSFTSLPKQKVYPLRKMMMNMLSYSHDPFPIYVTCSCGYFVIIADNSSLLLINPFTRIKKKVICPSTFESFSPPQIYRALLDFDKDSEEFVLVFLFYVSGSLHVYQSRNNGWVTCSTVHPHDIVDDDFVHHFVDDFVALNNIIYVVTSEARIGVLNLNSANIEFFRMANSLELEIELEVSSYNLVKCDEQLFLVRLNPHLAGGSPPPDRKVFKIDFSTMTYVELETLGDIALFYGCFNSCKALSNPNKWGYESNSVYQVCSHPVHQIPNCSVYNWDEKSLKYIAPPYLRTKGGSILDWYFII